MLQILSVFSWEVEDIVVSFNPIVLDDGKGDLKTKTGNMPDVLAKGGKSALSVCIEMIEKN